MSHPVITLTTDFGHTDAYVGVMKGVILGICPNATLVDLCHEVRPQAILQAAYLLSTAYPFFPTDTVHLAVVDPGVGSPRRPIALQTETALFVAPDNGLLGPILATASVQRIVELSNLAFHLPHPSATFHGRDLFAPVAAHLACGVPLEQMGQELAPADLVRLAIPEPHRLTDTLWLGEVIHIDRFGNLITNFQAPLPGEVRSVRVADRRVTRLGATFSDVGPGEPVLYLGSSGRLEIALREDSAAARLGVDLGAPVHLEVR